MDSINLNPEPNPRQQFTVEQRQKCQSYLFSEYNEAIKLLKAKNLEQGITNLERILCSPIISETQLRKLKKSGILSLANIMLIQKKIHDALLYFLQALQIERQIIRDEEEVFDPNSTNSSQYSLLMKMYDITQTLGYHQHSVFLLKNALIVSPSLWQQNVLDKLQKQYDSLEMHKELEDLRKLRMNPTFLRSVVEQEQVKITKKSKKSKDQVSVQNQIEDLAQNQQQNSQKQQVLKNLKIQIRKLNPSYSSIEYLLTVCYVLLKCQQKRNFNRKRYLHKKYDSSNSQWMNLLSEFSPTKTAIQIVFEPQKSHHEQAQKRKEVISQNKDDQNESISQAEQANKIIQEKNTNEGMIEQLTAQLLRIKYTKKKKNKPKNTVSQVESLPVLPTKFTNKKYPAQQKIIYDSINHYFNESLEKAQLSKDHIMWMQNYFRQNFNQHFSKLIEKPQDDDNQAEAQSQPPQVSKPIKPSDKQPDASKTKPETEKKLNAKDIKQIEMKKIQHQNLLLQDFFKNQINVQAPKSLSQNSQANQNQQTLRFTNVCELVQQLIRWIFQQQVAQNQQKQKDFTLLKSNHIRKLIAKTLLKIIPETKSFLKDLLPKSKPNLSIKSLFLLDILVQHLDFMSLKKAKTTEFTPHQNQKISWLSRFIEEQFQIDSRLIVSKNAKSEECCLIAMWSKSMIKFYTTKNNYDEEMIGFYKEICLYSNKKAKKQIPQLKHKFAQILEEFVSQTTQGTIEMLISERTQRMLNSDDSSAPITLAMPVSNKQPDIESLLGLLESNELINEEKQVFQKIVYFIRKYFEKLEEESESKEEFYVKQMQFMTQKYKINELINKLYNKFRNPQSGIIKDFETSSVHKESVLILLIKLCLMGSLTSNDDCLRILFYLTNIYLKERKDSIQSENQETRQKSKEEMTSLVSKIIVLYRSLVQYSDKKQKLQSISLVLRKFYQNIITKNLPIIYKETKEQWKQKKLKREELNRTVRQQFRKTINQQQLQEHSLLDIVKSLSISQQAARSLVNEGQILVDDQGLLSPATISLLQEMQLQDQIMDIINGLYYGSDSDFTPKKLEDAIGYFLFLSRNHSEEFQAEELQLSNAVVKVFKKCYIVFAEKKSELAKYCDKYKEVLAKVDKYWDGAEKENTELVEILRGNTEPCLCCTADKILPNFDYSEIVYILARFFESNAYLEENDENSSKKSSLEFTQLDQEYYKEFLMFNRKNPDAWINYIRVHCLKAYLHFDSLVSVQSIQAFKNKFLFTKRIINFVKLHLLEPLDQPYSQLSTSHQALKQFSIRTLNVLNILKLKEREFFMHLKQLEVHNGQKKEIKEATKKYLQGLKTISEKYDSLENITSIYLGIVELNLPEISFADLTYQTFDKITLLRKKVKQTILSLDKFQKDQNSIHLEQDLIVQFHIVVAKMMQNIVEKLLNNQKRKLPTGQIQPQNITAYNTFVNFWLNQTNQLAKQSKYLLHFRSSSEQNQPMIQEELQFIDVDENNLSDQEPSVSEIIEQEKNNQPNKETPAAKVFNFKPLESKQNLEDKNQNNPAKNSQAVTPNIQKKTKKSEIFQLDIKEYCIRKIKQQSIRSPLTVQEQELLRKMNTFLNALSILFQSLPRLQTKRYKYRRSNTTSLLYISQLYLKYFNEPSVSLDVIKDYFNIRSDDIVFIFTYSDRKSTQKNVVLSEFYNRAIVHNLQRLHFIKHLIDCYERSQNLESLIVLIRKLNKIMVSGGEEDNKEIKYLLMLYWYAVDAYVNLVDQLSVNKPIEERYEKILIEFKNRIKRSIQSKFQTIKIDTKSAQPEAKGAPTQNTAVNQTNAKQSKQKALKQNYYFEKIDKFIKNYEQRYEKKVKLKKSKKERELQKQLKEKGTLQKNEQLIENQLDQKNSPLPEAQKIQEIDEVVGKKIAQKIDSQKNLRSLKPGSTIQKIPSEEKKKDPLNLSVQIIENPIIETINPQEEEAFANQFECESQEIGIEGQSEEKVPQITQLKKEKLKEKKERKTKDNQKKVVVNLESDEDQQKKETQEKFDKGQQKAPQTLEHHLSDFLKAAKRSIDQLSPMKMAQNKKGGEKQFIVIEDDEDENEQEERDQIWPKKHHKPE